jgi:hypothetical protein
VPQLFLIRDRTLEPPSISWSSQSHSGHCVSYAFACTPWLLLMGLVCLGRLSFQASQPNQHRHDQQRTGMGMTHRAMRTG